MTEGEYGEKVVGCSGTAAVAKQSSTQNGQDAGDAGVAVGTAGWYRAVSTDQGSRAGCRTSLLTGALAVLDL
ncbi:hypothetical protein Anapl_12926 [Anas platyrhynchos]|uniref:Uncharacterized protein n=1 Tax=Anas platyrhynchos TaxID=8839 RepID=R0LKM2_ANAPL|nr:hypothetical protein Anapl_12926 [Anas platyrhynchos]